MLPKRHTTVTPRTESKVTLRICLGWLSLGLMALFATRQVATDLLYGYSLGIHYGPEGLKLQAIHHAQFHNLVLFSLLFVTIAMVWILDRATAPRNRYDTGAWRRTSRIALLRAEMVAQTADECSATNTWTGGIAPVPDKVAMPRPDCATSTLPAPLVS